MLKAVVENNILCSIFQNIGMQSLVMNILLGSALCNCYCSSRHLFLFLTFEQICNRVPMMCYH